MDISNPVIKDDINQMIDTAVIKSFEKQEISDKDDAKQEIDDQLNDDFKQLEQNSAVDDDLARLRAKLNQGG